MSGREGLLREGAADVDTPAHCAVGSCVLHKMLGTAQTGQELVLLANARDASYDPSTGYFRFDCPAPSCDGFASMSPQGGTMVGFEHPPSNSGHPVVPYVS